MPCCFAALTASIVRAAVVSESAAKMPPVWNQRTPVPAEDVVPVEIAGLELAGGGVAAVGDADGAADAEAALGEVEAVADGPADAVVLAPLDEVGGDAALHDEVLDQVADLVVDEGGADGGAQAEALAQAARVCTRRRPPRR